MANQSKASLSLLDAIPYTCYEVGHTWEPSCLASFLRSCRLSFINGMKVHIPIYLVNILFKSFKKEFNLIEEIKIFVYNLLRSSLFIATTGSLSLGGFCFLRHLIGKFYGWHSFFVALCVGYIGLHIEQKTRRKGITMYVLLAAIETLYGMAVYRNILKPLPHGEVVLFCIASAGFFSLYRTPEGLPEFTRSVLNFLVGAEEGQRPKKKGKDALSMISKTLQRNFYFRMFSEKFNVIPLKHPSCPHEFSCTQYFLEGISSSFLVGLAADLIISFLRRLRKVQVSSVANNLQLARFFTCYITLLRISGCVLRWLRKKDSPSFHGAVSGAIAGLASCLYRSSTISLYFVIKLIQVLTESSACSKYIPRVEYAEHHLFAFSLAIILHAAFLEPHAINPRFWKLFCDFSGGNFPQMFRKLLDVYGTNASALYPNFIPKLKKEFVTTDAVKAIMIAHGKW